MLKPIPIEPRTQNSPRNVAKAKKIPRIEAPSGDTFLKNIGSNVLSFFKKGVSATASQIDDIIIGLQRVILQLHKKKRQILAEKKRHLDGLEKGKKVTFRKKRIA